MVKAEFEEQLKVQRAYAQANRRGGDLPGT